MFSFKENIWFLNFQVKYNDKKSLFRKISRKKFTKFVIQ